MISFRHRGGGYQTLIGLPRAFTLVELLVVVSIIGLLAGLSIPAIQKATESGRRANCTSNLKNLSQAFLVFANQNESYLPSLLYNNTTWMGFLSEAGLIQAPSAFSDNRGKTILYCPSACSVRKPGSGNWNTYSMNDYAGERDPSIGSQSAFGMKLNRVSSLSKFALVMDGCWVGGYGYTANTDPAQQPPTGAHPASKSTNDPSSGVNVAFADGHVEMRKKSEIPASSTNAFWTGQN
jgi:prepilin-type N-terminal cleavage/methylation domain-containing protein/prepilin-type processing-associated H-X9-DG protein